MRPDVRPPLAFSRRPAARLPLRRHAALRRRLCSRRRSHRRGARARVRGLRRGRVRRAPPTLAARDAPADHGGAWQEVAAPAQGEEGSWSIIQLASGQLLPSVEERSASRCVPTHAATLIYNITEGRYAFLYRRVTSRDRHTGHRGRASSCCSRSTDCEVHQSEKHSARKHANHGWRERRFGLRRHGRHANQPAKATVTTA